MSKSFDYNVQINMAAFINEYKYLYGADIAIDTTTIVKNYISPIIFRMSNSDYNLSMKCLFHSTIGKRINKLRSSLKTTNKQNQTVVNVTKQ